MYKSIEVMTELYTGSQLEKFTHALREGVFSHLTDTVTLFAALAAIALPLAQQTLQWASDKYSSENLVEFVETNSPIHPKSLNKILIIYVAAIFGFKILSEVLNDFGFLFVLSLLILWFLVNVRRLILYFAYTYEMGKGLHEIRKRILARKLNLKKEMYTGLEISLLSDFEVYQLEHNSNVLSFSREYVELRHEIIGRLNDIDKDVVSSYLLGLQKAITKLPLSVSDKKYIFVVHNYIFFIQSLITRDSGYFYLLNELADLAEAVESHREGNEKSLLHGLVFQNITFHNDWPEGIEKALVSHFERLTMACIDTGQSEQTVHLFKEFNRSLGFSSIDDNALRYHFHPHVESYSSYKEVDALVSSVIKTPEELSPDSFTERIRPKLTGTVSEQNAILEEFWHEVRKFRYQEEGKVAVEVFLSNVAKADLKLILAIRETRNPIASSVHMLGYDLLPMSVGGVLKEVARIDSRHEQRIFRDEKYSQYLFKAYVALFMYEMAKTLVNGTNIENYQFVTQLKYWELDKLKQRVPNILSLQRHIMNSDYFSELFYLHSIDSGELKVNAEKYLTDLPSEIDKRIVSLSTTGKLENSSIERFRATIPSVKEVMEKYSFLKSKTLKISRYSKYKHRLSMSRKSFLPGTNVYHDFGRGGWRIVDSHFEQILNMIRKNSESMDASKVWPINHGRLVFIHYKLEDKLIKHGFKFIEGKMHWPNGSSCTYHRTRDDNEEFVNILPDEPLIQVPNLTEPLFDVNFVDDGKEIVWEFVFNIMPYGYRYDASSS
ncbi:hypothetical protein [Vibrio coralliilyticus]|uniref:hypothetical protein n=1 Tax=Vibrio coralliilyticus TaxID=190893 RepID=UPI00155F7BED|nr:hypothetical protein [Vibrio coralliilyticus]NRF28273.1 hypothetical protein [Vibrio coralliilyticus]NRF51916.1 hypothetical protein [Vibrio coralliilyticus]NRG03901.1 hypothetical protein [Vibrio coralliilyticus]